MDDVSISARTGKAFDFYSDATKQLITLSTGIIALMIAFSKDVLGSMPGKARYVLLAALIMYLLSILCGLYTLLSLTGELQPFNRDKNARGRFIREAIFGPLAAPYIYKLRIIIPNQLQVILFSFATIFIVITGGMLLLTPEADKQAINKLDTEWKEAYMRRDVDALDRILSEGFTLTNTAGKEITKSQIMQGVAADNFALTCIQNSDVKLRVYSDTAVLTGICNWKTENNNQAQTGRHRYTKVYRKQNTQWQMVSAQATDISQ